MSYLIFDIETVPDYQIWAPPEKSDPVDDIPRLDGSTGKAKPNKVSLAFLDKALEAVAKKQRLHPDDLKKALDIAERAADSEKAVEALRPLMVETESSEEDKEPFAPLYAHKVVAIGFLVMESNFTVTQFGCAGTTTHGDDEAKLLTDFGNFAAPAGTLVSFAGKRFDMPVILSRSYYYGVPQAWHGRDHRYKYDEKAHIDLHLAFTNYDYGMKDFSLDNVAKLAGVPGKAGVEGSMVSAMYDEGKHKEIELYCQRDCAVTAAVFLRFLLMRGQLSLERYQAAASNIVQMWQAWNPQDASLINEKQFLLK